jgi:AhpD family alkylhydroperoxidase
VSEGKYHDLSESLRDSGRELRKHIPEVYRGFAGLHRAAYEDGALSGKFKELLALAIAISQECDGCIVSHVSSAIRKGATEQEVAEAIGVAIAMMGGPGTVWGPRAFEVYQEYAVKEETRT